MLRNKKNDKVTHQTAVKHQKPCQGKTFLKLIKKGTKYNKNLILASNLGNGIELHKSKPNKIWSKTVQNMPQKLLQFTVHIIQGFFITQLLIAWQVAINKASSATSTHRNEDRKSVG